ncbi:hypothetical protein B0T16DRAFT_454895 [Cercophora newfieldiana]|uniref:Ankyrin repeat domain-containing protein n=1 Tax=Cercophora newfieldiana TaxID=92897 RepID=A0AA40CX91_9PEZI|nr:hypothetical protein B0T16DRAFT_454895 [Cercophora newfieldiana]
MPMKPPTLLTLTFGAQRIKLVVSDFEPELGLVRRFVELGADVNAPDVGMQSPIAVAVASGRYEAANIFLAAGARLDLARSSDLIATVLLQMDHGHFNKDTEEALLQALVEMGLNSGS